MTALKTVAVCLLLLLAVPLYCSANDVVLNYSLLEGRTVGHLWQGSVRVEVRNVGSGGLRNVDLRLALPSVDSLERNLFQFGGIPKGQSRSMNGGIVLDTSSSAPLLWKVDYDDAAGAHRQIVLPGN